MAMVRGVLKAWSLAHKRAMKISGRMEVNRPDGSRSAHVHTHSMAAGSGLAVSTLRT